MSWLNKVYKFILFIIDEVTNYLITVPIYHIKAEKIDDALIEHKILHSRIMDQDSTFMTSLMNYLFNILATKIKTGTPYNHQSLQAEHRIKSLPMVLTKHLTNLGQMWPKYLSLATSCTIHFIHQT